MAESSYKCPNCGKTVDATFTKALHWAGAMIGVDDYTHECIDGKVLHPFAIRPFPDSREDLWRLLHEKLDLRPAAD